MTDEDMVTVSSDLPSGIVLDVGGKTYVIPGPDRAKPKQKFGHAQIPAKFWNLWIAEHQDFAPVVNGNIKGPAPDDKAKDAADNKAKAAKAKAIDPNEPTPPRIPTGQIEPTVSAKAQTSGL